MNFNYILNKNNTTKATVQTYFYQNKSKLILNSILCAVIFAAALVMGIKTKERLMFLICIVCAIRVISIFYTPYSNAKISAGAFYDNREFSFELIENGVAITPKDSERKEIVFKENVKAFETKDFFIVLSNSRFFPIPKEFMDNEQISTLSEVISKTFGNKK